MMRPLLSPTNLRRSALLGLTLAGSVLSGCAIVQTPYGPALMPLGAVQSVAAAPAPASGVVTPAPTTVYVEPAPVYYYGYGPNVYIGPRWGWGGGFRGGFHGGYGHRR